VNHIGGGAEESDVRTGWQGETLVHLDLTQHTGFQIVIRDKIGLELIVRWDLRTVEVFLRRHVILSSYVLHLGFAGGLAQILELGWLRGHWAGLARHLSVKANHRVINQSNNQPTLHRSVFYFVLYNL